ncbi:MAG: hypothetical protein GAK35_00475 [Herbaspirillum frisingense]|uniref:Uncharacterized protein n=1 Tax=Herbaspirillum frisingense TaxID=92645 RepID=A0A7V8FZZ3_9BURK|nr:MAG: hypothetical protein GAK35_00475 [Herbaspirillum frisingense]
MKLLRLPIQLARAVLRLPYLLILGILDVMIWILAWINRKLGDDEPATTSAPAPAPRRHAGGRHLLDNEPLVGAMRDLRLSIHLRDGDPASDMQATLRYGDGHVLLQARGAPAELERQLLAALEPDAPDAPCMRDGQVTEARYVRDGACLHVLPDDARGGRALLVNVATLEQLRAAVHQGLAHADTNADTNADDGEPASPQAEQVLVHVPTVPRFKVNIGVGIEVPIDQQPLVERLMAAGARRAGWSDEEVYLELDTLAPRWLLQAYPDPLRQAKLRLDLRLGEHLSQSGRGGFEQSAATLLAHAETQDGHAQPVQERGTFVEGSYVCNGVYLAISAADYGSPEMIIHAIARDTLRKVLASELDRLRSELTPA